MKTNNSTRFVQSLVIPSLSLKVTNIEFYNLLNFWFTLTENVLTRALWHSKRKRRGDRKTFLHLIPLERATSFQHFKDTLDPAYDWSDPNGSSLLLTYRDALIAVRDKHKLPDALTDDQLRILLDTTYYLVMACEVDNFDKTTPGASLATSVGNLAEALSMFSKILAGDAPEDDMAWTYFECLSREEVSSPLVSRVSMCLEALYPVFESVQSSIIALSVAQQERTQAARAKAIAGEVSAAVSLLESEGYTVSKPESTKKGKSK